MQIKPEQLTYRLREQLAPVYFISGDDPLRVLEAADAVREQARAQGYEEREVLTVQPGFDWNSLLEAAGNLSLFSQRRLLDLRLPTGKPGDQGARALRAFAERPAEDTILLITSGKLEPQSRKSKWVQALDAAGVVVFVWPLDAGQLRAWIRERMQKIGMEPTRDAVAMLSERVEGNLLACVQEIDKLYLLHGAGSVNVDEISAVVADSARFDVFGLVDSALAGEGARCLRIFSGLQGEAVEPVLVLWALAREIRQLAAMAAMTSRGMPVAKALARFRVWESRKRVLAHALGRLPDNTCKAMLRHCAHVDRVIKGQDAGNPWDELLQLLLQLAGGEAAAADLQYKISL